MASKSMHLKMARKGRPVHCADGKWRTAEEAGAFSAGWDDMYIFGKSFNKQAREHYIAGIVARFKADRKS